MIKQITQAVWDIEVSQKLKSSFFDSSFLTAVADSFGYKPHYFVYQENNTVLMAAALYSCHKNIVTALPYTYSSVWFEQNISDRKFLLIADDFIKHLKTGWKKISLRLPVEITDVRPFIWGGFKISNRYTYLKYTNSDFPKKIIKTAELATIEGMTLSVIKAEKIDIIDAIKSLKEQIFNKKAVESNFKALTEFANKGYLLAFRAYFNGSCVCTSLMYVDQKKEKSYALLIGDSDHKFAHVFINYERSRWCAKNNISIIDFCGANEPGIASFKSVFNGTLKQYYIASYNPNNHFLRQRDMILKKFIKKMLGR